MCQIKLWWILDGDSRNCFVCGRRWCSPMNRPWRPEGEQRDSSTLCLTSVLGESGLSVPHHGCFSPGKETQCPYCRMLGVPQCHSEWVWKISTSPGFDPCTVQPVASHYTDRCPSVHYFVYVMKLLRDYLQAVIPVWVQMAEDNDASVGNSGIKSNENVLVRGDHQLGTHMGVQFWEKEVIFQQ